MEDYETAEQCRQRIKERTNKVLSADKTPIGDVFGLISDYIDYYLKCTR